MDVNKLRKKQNRFRCLKTISYLLGYPLFILLVMIGSMSLFEGDVFTDTKWFGVIAAVVVWLIAIVAQIVISIITKSYNGRTIGMIVVSLVVLIGASVVFDVVATKKIDEIAEEYEKHNVEVQSYKYQTGWVVTWTSRDSLTNKLVDDINQFCAVYNIKYKSNNYGKVNGDKSSYTEDKKADANYSANGLYADGYVFGFKQAVQVLIDYNQAKFDIENKYVEDKDKDGKVTGGHYEKNGKDADEELEKALKALDNDAEWKAYKNSAEYVAAYGKDGSAYTFMLNEERLSKLIAALGESLGKTNIVSIFGGLLEGFGISPDDLKNLTLDKVVELINGFNLFDEPVDKAQLFELLQNFSYYQSPSVKPKFAFIKDDTLRKFAYANYHATVHGANVGSVLIAKDTVDEDGKVVAEGRIGKVNMSDSGYPNSFAYSLEELYDLQARDKVANSYYPFMIARRYGFICSGIVAFTTILFYVFKRKEDETFEQLVEARGGVR